VGDHEHEQEMDGISRLESRVGLFPEGLLSDHVRFLWTVASRVSPTTARSPGNSPEVTPLQRAPDQRDARLPRLD
jgi:hypothetical protein